ncbi:RNA polymerase sigma-70 factor, ECF subfamily [Arachidicoccus rhizosphaerae]|uniref:RNA polymerase sigma-70 factor, ECF subfamily n=1 Tax=Arachidicoccus rhizosphaerae TaxID=551991 RepID=A0A1H4ACT1_9BACT|nr:sigma-70 family RNA polymerase sigma factor [Arachidicoccus rhizosphaerae]SEA33541.1 RNA polymerase sigma-70 factor, ECF subfamily [Arachidicoccus rhizosphaerae]
MTKEHLNNEFDLIIALKKGDETAYSYLYDQYGAALYGFIIHMTKEQELAKDILQEVFIKIFQKIDLYDPQKGPLYAWLIQITRNTTLDKLRSKQYQTNRRTLPLEEKNISGTLENTIQPKLDHIGVDKVLVALDESHKKVIDLAYFHGFTQNEIAKEMGLPVGTVKTKVRNALIQLRKLLNIV